MMSKTGDGKSAPAGRAAKRLLRWCGNCLRVGFEARRERDMCRCLSSSVGCCDHDGRIHCVDCERLGKGGGS